MEWTGLNELREKYLRFFESKGHLRLPSFPLIPQNDNSLLLINSGMAPMKKYFTGEITPPRKRITTCQKCIRTPDIERVGKTARHGTYFEMLGNFSFGDYFKHEATKWAWEFFTEVLEMPVDRLWVTIYEDDDEAFDIWTKEVGVSPDRIVRLGKEDNFWEHGSGPCGPCSELHFDRGEQYSCGKPGCAVGCDCDRYVEVWNLVFTQFESDGKGTYTPLDHPNIDTGMGLERLACVMQGVENLFEVDTVQRIMQHISKIAGVPYKQNDTTDVSLRVITDHIRSTTMMIGDGVMPSNEGRGYVLRRLLRRAARHGKLLGIDRPFLSEVAVTVIAENKEAYPELLEKQDLITRVIKEEEESFGRTIDKGMQLLSELINLAKDKRLSGEDAFRLYDTYGFPLDLTRDILEECGMTVDEESFEKLMREQKKRARAARKNAGAEAWDDGGIQFDGIDKTDFVGYDTLCAPAKIKALVNGGEKAALACEGENAVLVLDTTPFYGESGGQAGDCGEITNAAGGVFVVEATAKTPDGIVLHIGKVKSGNFELGSEVTASVCEKDRMATMRNHTAAHLLQAALRRVLGTHVEQAGQLVNADRVRFDFTHFSALSNEEIAQVEALVNEEILKGETVEIREMPIDEAKKLGAMALFGEKYGDIVRVVKAGSFSTELCGGTHVPNTGRIGLFRIISETSVAAGVRRIEAVTGDRIIDMLNHYEAGMQLAATVLKSGADNVAEKARALMAELKEKDRMIEKLEAKLAGGQLDELFSHAEDISGLRLITGTMKVEEPEALRAACDKAKENADVVALLACVSKKGTVTLAAACGKDAVAKGAHAGNLVKAAAKLVGGNGGGRPDSAMAGGKDPSGIQDALSSAKKTLEDMIK